MRNPKRIKPYCDALASIWGAVPDWRLGQFMWNIIRYYEEQGKDPFYMEDEEFLAGMITFLNEMRDEPKRKNGWEIGDKIRIIRMSSEPQYTGREGIVEYIDDAGQIHGSWGGCALIPGEDVWEVLG